MMIKKINPKGLTPMAKGLTPMGPHSNIERWRMWL
jgi:hypothetical protein